MNYRVPLLAILLLLIVFCPPASAHNEAMAGSKWYFGRNNIRVVMELAPSLLRKIKGVADGHHAIETCSEQELRQTVGKVIQPYLDRNLSVSVNGKPYPLKIDKLERKNGLLWDIYLSLDGIGFDLPENEVAIDYRLFFDETDDTHFNLAYMYAFDARAQKVPETMPDSSYLERTTLDAANHVWRTTIQVSAAAQGNAGHSFWSNVAEFFVLGIKHILSGYDHIAFLLALIVIGLSVREVLKIITAFTVAHSITLLLAALQIVRLNAALVEIMIAFSICYVALENLFRKEIRNRWVITFGFGLIHGFGFASVLQELIKDRAGLLPSVVSFNLGVEAGQLMIFFVMIPVLWLCNRKFESRRIAAVTSTAVFAVGFCWLIERTFDISILPL